MKNFIFTIFQILFPSFCLFEISKALKKDFNCGPYIEMAKTYGNKIAVFQYLKFTDYVITEMIKIIYLKILVKKLVCLAFIVPDLVSPTVVI